MNTTEQTVFLHIYPIIGEVNESYDRVAFIAPELAISIYLTETEAEEALKAIGGMILESSSDKLKGRIEGDVLLSKDDSSTARLPVEIKTLVDRWRLPGAQLICGRSLPYKNIPDPEWPDTEVEWGFSSEADKWIDRFCEESGTHTHL